MRQPATYSAHGASARGSVTTALWLLGARVASDIGPLAWRILAATAAFLLLRYGLTIWYRLGLARLGSAFLLAAAFCVEAGFYNSYDDLSGLVSWPAVLGSFALVIGLVYWERQASTGVLQELPAWRASSTFVDRLLLRHIPDLRHATRG